MKDDSSIALQCPYGSIRLRLVEDLQPRVWLVVAEGKEVVLKLEGPQKAVQEAKLFGLYVMNYTQVSSNKSHMDCRYCIAGLLPFLSRIYKCRI